MVIDNKAGSIIQQMSAPSRKSFREMMNSHVLQFYDSVQRIYSQHQIVCDLEREPTIDALLNCVAPPSEDDQINAEALSNFLQSTLNNQTEKKLKKKYCTKDLSQLSGSTNTKLFHNVDSIFHSQSGVMGPFSHKLTDSSANGSGRWQGGLENYLAFQLEAKQEHMSENASNRSDSDSIYHSRSSEDSKKHYKLYPDQLKHSVVQYASSHGIKEACDKYNISAPKIGIWSRSLSRVKQARGRKPIDPEMEEKVCRWLREELDKGTILTQKIIREKAKRISCSDDFKASKGWLEKFFKRRPELFTAYSQNRKPSAEPYPYDDRPGIKLEDTPFELEPLLRVKYEPILQ